LVVACGALSGFHSLVGSGTSSKQLANEAHGLLVGYGGMLTEGFLSTMVIAILGSFAFEALVKAGLSLSQAQALADPATAAATWTSILGKYKWFTIIPYSYAAATNTVLGLPFEAMAVFSALWITGFALTSLDTATRLGRFAWQELMTPLKDKAPSVYKVLANRWVGAIIILVLATPLAWGAAWKVLWPAFAGMNQLLASLALMTVALWAAKVQRTTALGKGLTFTPAFFLWITVTVALIWYEAVVVPATVVKNPLTGYTVGIITGVGLALNIMLLIDFLLALRRPTPST
ncbi:MAG TPA: carbon starvation protein A, partial [Acidilobales archaeon]|nr:carbon starvation protein A [Acidilobales archaeon]